MSSNQTLVNVSIPRSGHHLLINLLTAYFGPNNFQYCEFYRVDDCCKSIPCTKPGIDIQKNHDFNLDLQFDKKQRYIVSYRNFIRSTISDYELYTSGVMNAASDTEMLWVNFCLFRMRYWKAFIEKWIFPVANNTHPVSYERLIEAPHDQLATVIRFLRPKEVIDESALNNAINKIGIMQERNIQQFKYYNPYFFCFIEDSLKDYYDRLNIETVDYDDRYGQNKNIVLTSMNYLQIAHLLRKHLKQYKQDSINMSTRVTRELVELGYLILLNRAPESEAVIKHNISSNRTIDNLRAALIGSKEFKTKQPNKDIYKESCGRTIEVTSSNIELCYAFISGIVPTKCEVDNILNSGCSSFEEARNIILFAQEPSIISRILGLFGKLFLSSR